MLLRPVPRHSGVYVAWSEERGSFYAECFEPSNKTSEPDWTVGNRNLFEYDRIFEFKAALKEHGVTIGDKVIDQLLKDRDAKGKAK